MKEQCQEDIKEDSMPSESEEELTTTTSKEEEDSDLTTKEDSSIEVMGMRLKPLDENQDVQVVDEVQTQEQPQGHEEMIEDKAAGGLILVSPKGEVVTREQVILEGSTRNNEEEYDVLINGLKTCLAEGIQHLMVKGVALLIVKQILGICACKNERLRSKVTVICKLCGQFKEVQLYHIPRKENEDADLLSQQAITGQDEVQVIIAAATMKELQYAGKECLAPIGNYILEGESPKELSPSCKAKGATRRHANLEEAI
ncbi:hypothetical protein L7F22_008134 [Adiantum nelumboides]|nr:hypothetical protein [Adiantum nelumboides]